MIRDLNTGQTHYVGDGCHPPHLPIGNKPPQTPEEIIQLFQDYADKNEDENVRMAVKIIREKLKQ